MAATDQKILDKLVTARIALLLKHPFSGFQRMESGAFVFRQDTLEQVGYMPNFGGHHDCVIVPSKVEEMKFSRSCTV